MQSLYPTVSVFIVADMGPQNCPTPIWLSRYQGYMIRLFKRCENSYEIQFFFFISWKIPLDDGFNFLHFFTLEFVEFFFFSRSTMSMFESQFNPLENYYSSFCLFISSFLWNIQCTGAHTINFRANVPINLFRFYSWSIELQRTNIIPIRSPNSR